MSKALLSKVETNVLVCLKDAQEGARYVSFYREAGIQAEGVEVQNLLRRIAVALPDLLLIAVDFLPRHVRDTDNLLHALAQRWEHFGTPVILGMADNASGHGTFDPLDSHYAPFDACFTQATPEAVVIAISKRALQGVRR